jgi:hypothetical protein
MLADGMSFQYYCWHKQSDLPKASHKEDSMSANFSVIKDLDGFTVRFSHPLGSTTSRDTRYVKRGFWYQTDTNNRIVLICWSGSSSLPQGFERHFGVQAAKQLRAIVRASRGLTYVEISSRHMPKWAHEPPFTPDVPQATQVLSPRRRPGDKPFCYTCGNEMQKAGSCYVCSNCGAVSGVSAS